MLGVCYYPEQWPERMWADDARRMRHLGISVVRIGEFAWSFLEPEPGRYDFAWLDRAVDTLARENLNVVLGTPTATPPKWLVDAEPSILAHDAKGQPRRFGSRRHYCFSSERYRAESRRITEALAKRYGGHPALVGWQTDNEFGCHNTTRSYSPEAARAFRRWLRERYQDTGALNEAWGNAFWSMRLRAFDEADLPMQAVTELNPAHRMAFHRFSSDQIAAFNREQVEIIRAHSPGRFVTHNFMGAFLEFDHFDVGRDLDLASWDSYPLGFTDTVPWLGLAEWERTLYHDTGHPDIAAFHHDLYRRVGRGRFWVMEQQPGPVNWALWNPAPHAGMVRAWTWEALAHGAEAVCYFRWRQAPFAQEQMHAGLKRPDDVRDVGGMEAATVAYELQGGWWKDLAKSPRAPAPVALVFDYPAAWAYEIQPQGFDQSYFPQAYAWYGALRRLGLNVDIVAQGDDLSAYKAVIVPTLPIVTERGRAAFAAFEGPLFFGPRSGAKTHDMTIPDGLPPGPLRDMLPIKVTRVESLRPGVVRALDWNGARFEIGAWVEWIELGQGRAQPLARFADGRPALVECNRQRFYLACQPTRDLVDALAAEIVKRARIRATPIPETLRKVERGGVTFAFNYDGAPAEAPAPSSAEFLLGTRTLAPKGGLAAWR